MASFTNADIDRYIQPFLTKDRTSRPFLCHGSPIGCEVAVVGINPATSTPFQDFWSIETGFDKLTWLQKYKEIHGRFKPTRDRLETFCTSLNGVRCLELNLFSHPSPNEATLLKEHRSTKLFEFMLQTCKPMVLLVHGNSPIAHLSQLLKVTLQKDAFTDWRHEGNSMQIFTAKRHLAYVSRDYAASIANLIAHRIQDIDPLV